MCIIRSPISITVASSVKIINRYLPVNIKSVLMQTAVPTAIARQTRVPFFTRSYLAAPKFCPTNVVTAIPKELLIIQNRQSIFPYAVHAAIVSTPNRFNADWIIILERLYIDDWIPVGRPMRRIFFNTGIFNRISFNRRVMPSVRYIRV